MTPLAKNKEINKFGFRVSDLDSIIAILKQEPEVDEVILFGSRAKGNYKNGSDVDLAIKGSNLSHATIRNISYELNEETLMPYTFDVVNYHLIKNVNLTEHIDRMGISIYNKQ